MQPDTPTSKYFKSIYDLPLCRFIDCMVDGNLAMLTIEGIPNEQELTSAWDTILNQYTESIGSQELRMYKAIYCELEELRITLEQIQIAVDVLTAVYDPFFHKELNSLLRTTLRLNEADPATYQSELSKCVRRSKSIKIRLDMKSMEFSAMQKKHQSGGPVDRAYFVSYLITLSDHAKYAITDQIKVGEYCERIKRYCEYCESLKKKAHG